jgi:hypothetical protein
MSYENIIRQRCHKFIPPPGEFSGYTRLFFTKEGEDQEAAGIERLHPFLRDEF